MPVFTDSVCSLRFHALENQTRIGAYLAYQAVPKHFCSGIMPISCMSSTVACDHCLFEDVKHACIFEFLCSGCTRLTNAAFSAKLYSFLFNGVPKVVVGLACKSPLLWGKTNQHPCFSRISKTELCSDLATFANAKLLGFLFMGSNWSSSSPAWMNKSGKVSSVTSASLYEKKQLRICASHNIYCALNKNAQCHLELS